MSSYVYRKAIRYKLPKDKVSKIDLSDYDYFDDSFKEIMNIPENLEVRSAWSDHDEHCLYLDKTYEEVWDEISGDFTKSRYLTDSEVTHHLPDFQEFDKSIEGSDLRAVEYCYYNGVDEPDCYDVDDDIDDWIF